LKSEIAPPTLTTIVDTAILAGARFSTDPEWARVYCDVPSGFPSESLLELQEHAAGMRVLVKLRCLADWLATKYEQWPHGESLLVGDQYGGWLDVFAGSDGLLRNLFSFTGCIWGARTCNEAALGGYAPVLCEACASAGQEA
jgi:hypothetical protein